jgi:hypothetical protein
MQGDRNHDDDYGTIHDARSAKTRDGSAYDEGGG